MHFERVRASIPYADAAYVGTSHGWRFLIIDMNGGWSMSYRQVTPNRPVSASSTLRNYGDFDGCVEAAEKKLAELRRLS